MEGEHKDSGGEQRDEDEGLGPRSNVSLLDQHQHLKEKAEGTGSASILEIRVYSRATLLLQQFVFVSTARKESAKEKQLKEEEKILESVAEGRGKITKKY